MVFGLFKIFKKKDSSRAAGGVDMLQTQGDTVGDTIGGDYTQEDLDMATRDLENERKRKRRRRLHRDANLIRLNLRQRLTMSETNYVDVIGKQAPPVEVEQETADKLFAQSLAEAVVDLEQEDFQSRARFTHLGYMDYWRQRKQNAAYHKRQMDMYNTCDVGPTTMNSKKAEQPKSAGQVE